MARYGQTGRSTGRRSGGRAKSGGRSPQSSLATGKKGKRSKTLRPNLNGTVQIWK